MGADEAVKRALKEITRRPDDGFQPWQLSAIAGLLDSRQRSKQKLDWVTLTDILPAALEKYQKVILLTHVPPFEEACRHRGRPSDDNWLPHFACQATGQVIRQAALEYVDKHIHVLCGHTHGYAEVDIEPNLHVSNAKAVYGKPKIASVIEVQ